MEDFLPFTPTVLTVTALSNYLREVLESDPVLQDIWSRVRFQLSAQIRPFLLHAQRQRVTGKSGDVEAERLTPPFRPRTAWRLKPMAQ